MTQTVFVNAGQYKGRWMSMTDADADAARAGNWAFDQTIGPHIPDANMREIQALEVDEESLATWEAKLVEGDYDPTEGGSTEPPPVGPPANSAPTAVSLNPSTIPADAAIGAVVGTLTATDADAGDTHTFEIVNDAGGYFTIEADQLKFTHTGAIEAGDYPVTVKATDAGGLSVDGDVTVTITPVGGVGTQSASQGRQSRGTTKTTVHKVSR
jgi:hypothetical protein